MEKDALKFQKLLSQKVQPKKEISDLVDEGQILDDVERLNATAKQIVKSFKSKGKEHRTIRSLAADLNLTPTEIKSALNLNQGYFAQASFTSATNEPLYYLKRNG